MKNLSDLGVRVCINSDDPPFFFTSLAREYALATDAFGFSDAEINRMTRTALECAFVDKETRARLLAKLDGA